MVVVERDVLYQGRAEPVLVPAAPSVPDFGWFIQGPDVIRPTDRIITEGVVSSTEPILPSFDWSIQQSDVIQPISRLVPEAYFSLGDPIIPAFDWSVLQPDVVRLSERVITEGYTSLGEPIPPGVVPDFDWFVQGSDVVRPKSQLTPEAYVFPGEPILPDFGWFIQQAFTRGIDPLVPEGYVNPGEPIIPEISWDIPQAEVIRRGPEPIQSQESRAEVVEEPIPDFGWFVQQSFSQGVEEDQPKGFITEVLLPPEVTVDSWFQQEPEQVFRAPFRPYNYRWLSLIFLSELVTLDK